MIYGENHLINYLEIIWFSTGLVGILVNHFNFIDIVKDQAVLFALRQNGDKQFLVRLHLYKEIGRSAINLLVMTIGAYSFTIAPSPSPRSPLGWFFTVTLMLLPLINVGISFLDLTARKILRGKRGE